MNVTDEPPNTTMNAVIDRVSTAMIKMQREAI